MIPTKPDLFSDSADVPGCARSASSFDAQRWLEIVDRIGNPTVRRVGLGLFASYGCDETTESISYLGLVAAASRTSVKRALRRLEAEGLLTRIPQAAPSGATQRNRYRLTLPARWRGGQP